MPRVRSKHYSRGVSSLRYPRLAPARLFDTRACVRIRLRRLPLGSGVLYYWEGAPACRATRRLPGQKLARSDDLRWALRYADKLDPLVESQEADD
jgi:hypothetical protein